MNQACINVRMIPNFNFLADHYKVSEDTLKEIIYKYRIETNNEDAMPTDTYIQAQLGKMQYVDASPSARKLWERDYKDSKEFASIDKFKEAKAEALKFFPTKALNEYTNEKKHWVLAVKEPVEKIVPKKRSDFPSWQEYNDYLLTYGDAIPAEAREKEQQVIGKQPFTFKDGTTVTVPFRPNSQQEEALNAMNDFLKSKETSMTLSGYAGTGKTSLMEIIAKKAKKEGRPIVFSASTNKAAAVLRDRVKSVGFTANTLNKVFGIQVEVDSRKPYDATNLVNKLKEADITPGTVVVIDEASMINEENFKILNGIAQENGLKIIYVGDKGQLAPVNEDKVSKVFRNQNGRIVSLTKVERTDDNAILEEATNLRNGETLSYESSFNKEGKGVAFVKKSNKDSIKKIVEKFVPQLKQNPDYFRILAYTNAAVARYNDAVRRTLGYTDNTPRVNEPIVGYDNWGYVWDRNGGTYRFINSEAYKVTKAGTPREIYWTVDSNKVKLQAVPVTIQDSMGKTQEIDFIDVKGNPENRKAALTLAKEKVRLWNQAMSLPRGSKVRTSLLAEKNALEEFLFVNDNIVEDGKTLQKKVFDFGYAMTVHKSQGSTFTHVMVDDADIATAKNNPRGNEWEGVVIGEPVDNIGEGYAEAPMEVQESGNIFDLMNQVPENTAPLASPTTSNNNSINLRQQLEYVAVSRATDTVTVIANDANVKKEDTPLNHIKEQNPTLPSAKSNLTDSKNGFSEKTINQENLRSTKEGQFISATIAPYFSTSYEDYVNMSAEEQKEMRDAFGAAAKKVAGLLGINLDMKKASFNIGGYEFTETTLDGKDSIVEPSFTFRLDTTHEKARLFAALMGDLGFQQQEAVVSNYDVATAEEADGIRFSILFSDSEALLKLIDQFEIKNFTYDKTKGVLSVLSFDTADVEKFHKLVNKLKENGYDKESETFYFKSSYDGRTSRKTLYGKWLKAQERNSQGVQPELYSLVQEALKRVNYYSDKPSNYEGLIEPDEDTIFIFGSNPKGIHGAGAAATAKARFGAIQGQGEGLQGNAYALPTKDLDKAKGTRWYKPGKKEETEVKEWYKTHDYSEVQNHPLNTERTMTPQQIIESIKKLYEVANQNPDKQFKVSHYPFGQLSLNGYLGEEMLAMFKQAGQIPSNIIFNKEWTDHWDEIQSIQQQISVPFKGLELYSGGAKGSDTAWGDAVTKQGASQSPMQENHSSSKEIGNYVINYNSKTVYHKYISTESYKVQDLPRIERLKSILERAGEQGGEHRIKYYQFKKIDELITKATEERGDYREKATTSLLYKIYGKNLTGVYDYDNSSKELIVNNWVFDLLQVAQESPKEIAGLVDFITDKYDEESIGIEVAIQDYSDIITGINSIKNSQQSAQQPISFTESTGGYPQRTRENAEWSDITLDLTESNRGSGGANELTKRVAGNKYVHFQIHDSGEIAYDSDEILASIKEAGLPTTGIKLNIAGSEIGKLKHTQEEYNNEVERLIRGLLDLGVTISEIRSGGQTGMDEAGIIAAQRLGIPASVHAPKGFLFRTAEGKDIADRDAFESRFNRVSQLVQQQNVQQETSSPTPVSYPIQMDNLGKETGERLVQVDAEWKSPILLDLDYQLGQTESESEKNNIMQQMQRVKDATSEEDYQKAPTAERQEVNDKMTDYWRRNNQMNALMDNEVGLAASEVREVAEDIVNSISDIITEIQANPEKVKEYFPTLNITKDLSTATRKEIVQTVSINNLIKEAKRRFEDIRYNEDNSEAYELYNDSFELMDQADLILDNWDTIMELAADVFVVNEGFSIKRDTKKQSFETAEREFTGYDYDNFTDPQDEDAIREQENEQEHWQVEARTIDAFNSMSDQVRLAYHNCYELDQNGNKILNKWGIPRRVNKVTAVAKTLRWTQGAMDINQMVEKLSQKEARNPWINQLIRRLIDTTGKEADFQSQFFGVMHRHFQLYSIGQLTDGVYASKTLNNHVALSEIMKGITAQYQLKGHPLFNADGSVKADGLKELKKWHEELGKIVSKYNIRFNNGKYSSNNPMSDADIETAAKNLTAASRMLGYTTSEESVKNVVNEESLHKMWSKLGFAVGNLEKAGKDYDPFNFETENNIRSEVMGFLTPIIEELEDAATNAFFDNGKMYQSYVIPSFLTQLFDQFKQSDEKFYQWVEEFYGQSEWFKNSDGTWRLDWLEQMTRDPKAREIFDHKVQLNFNKHDYMRNMTPEEFTLSVFMEYFAERIDNKNVDRTPAWFRVPIQSNKPSSEFIKFYADRSPAYKEHIVEKMYGMFLQELSRIDTVRKRNKKEGDADFIASFDENGRKFQFLPWLNPFLEDSTSELGKLIQKKIKAEKEMSSEEDARLMFLVQEATMDYMQQRANNILQNWEETGILKAAEKIKGIKSLNHSVKENLENFLWNDFFAANSILQLTIVDKAFYPHATELQKRLAELHAPGTRGNKYATDYNGKRVSDGFYRTILINDLKGFTANIIDNISVIFDRKIAAAPTEEKAAWVSLKESLVGENGAYRRINVTDGQAYSSPSSYRKKAFMFGKWSHKAEDIYQRLLKGDFSITDLEVAFQPLKPFVYGHVSKDMGVDVAPISKMPVPFQAKNSEYLLILADALMKGQETGRPNLLKAIYDIMEESEKLHPGQGIDTVQFDSAIKSGNQAVIDITPFLTMPGGEAGAYTLMKSLMFQDSPADDGTNYNYSAYVHKTDYDNYALQQEVPAHFREHSQAEGSQQRMNIPTDLDFYNYDGEVNNYSWKDPDGTEHKMNAKEFRQEYERVHAANIEDSFNTLAKELHLNSSDRKARNLALSEILQDEIISSPRYGIDLFIACQIDPATGEFRIPKGDPIQGKRIEQLVNSIIKNRVNKQKVSGGPIVQVSNFGTSKQLHIRFHDKNGGILMTKEEYENSVKEQPTSQTDKFNAKYGKKTGSTSKSYEQYLKENQAGIAHFEIFAPIGMKKVFEKFKNPDGTINLEAVERCDPELLKVITARIPNEDKYSIAHGKIVGFMPALAGDAIMFPYELTEIDDSDFDVDKRYTMQKVMDIVTDWGKVKDGLMKAAMAGLNKAKTNNPEWYKKWAAKKNTGQSDRDVILNQVEMFMDNPEQMKDADALMKSMYQEYQRILQEEYPYKTVYPKKGTRDANNNQIIDMCWAVMSNEMTADKVLNPGGFEVPKHTAYVIAAYRNSDGTISWEQLEGMTTKELQKLAASEKDLAWFNDHVQFYKQNAAGSNLIGVFAVNKVAHATLEGDGLLINIEDFCGEKPFTIADMEFKGMMPVDDALDTKGMRIGKNIGSGIGASADTAKDPWLDSINVNMTTAGMFNTLLRMRMPMEDAELFMAQDVILRMMNEFNRKSLENKGTTLDKIIQDRIDTIKKKNEYTEDSEINTQPLTREELKEGLIPLKGNISQEREAIEYKTLLAFQKLKTLAKAIRKPTLVTRLNSVSSAVGPLIIDNIILEHKLNSFLQIEDEDTTGFYTKNPDGTFSPVDMDDILNAHPILKEFSKPIDSRNPNCPTRIMFSDMPAGSSLFKAVLKALPNNIDTKIYDDRQLLSKLSDFFQSYFLVANDVVKPEELKYYIEEFPKEFTGVGKSKGIKEQYPDNAFVQAIQLNYEKKSQRAFLNINTTGMKEQEKERLRMAWTDLHKTNPELSTKLFNYAFFRGGIGFSPKTFMGLVPTYVKEHLTGYIDTYRHFPKIMEDVVIEQFVRNNWDNSTLVPRKGGENTKYQVDLDNGTLIVRDENDKKDLAGVKFMKTVIDKETYLWKLLGTEDTNKRERYYVRIYPLGNNGEYMEMSTAKNMNALTRTTELNDNNDITELPETSPIETDAAEADTPTSIPETDSQQSKTLAALVPNVMHLDPKKSPEAAKQHLENYAEMLKQGKLTSGHKKYLVNLLNDAGVQVTMDNVLKEFKKFC